MVVVNGEIDLAKTTGWTLEKQLEVLFLLTEYLGKRSLKRWYLESWDEQQRRRGEEKERGLGRGVGLVTASIAHPFESMLFQSPVTAIQCCPPFQGSQRDICLICLRKSLTDRPKQLEVIRLPTQYDTLPWRLFSHLTRRTTFMPSPRSLAYEAHPYSQFTAKG